MLRIEDSLNGLGIYLYENIQGEEDWNYSFTSETHDVLDYSSHLFGGLGIGNGDLDWIVNSVQIEFQAQEVDLTQMMGISKLLECFRLPCFLQRKFILHRNSSFNHWLHRMSRRENIC